MNSRLFSEKKRIALHTAWVFLTLGLVFLCVSFLVQSVETRSRQTIAQRDAASLIESEKNIVTQSANQLVSDTLFIKDSLHFQAFSGHGHEAVDQIWVSFLNRRMKYDQIRFLDTDGNEVIRVNYDEAGAYAVAQDELQNKKDRYYFQDTIGLQNNQLYVSKADLNVENGEIEQPIKPMLRLSTPIFTETGELEGVVVVNYLAEYVLRRIRSVAESNRMDIFLLNADGYYLLDSADPAKEWAFMYDDRTNESFAAEFPQEWPAIKACDTNSLVSENGAFFYSRILTASNFELNERDASLVLGSGDWYFVTYLPASSEDGQLFQNSFWQSLWKTVRGNAYVYLMILLISLVIAVLLSAYRQRNEELKYLSDFDVMTGVYNRGAAFRRIDLLRRRQMENRCGGCVCFVDINGLKEVNDTLGHDRGDELILSVVKGIRAHTREEDFVARIGGDEFLILYVDANEEEGEAIWGRIAQEYARINETEGRPYLVSASHGIEAMDCRKNVDDIINRADEKMYREKRVVKQTLQVIRDGSKT